MMGALFALVVKEFLVLFKDRRSRMVVTLTPILQLFVFSYATTFDLEQIPYAYLDRERSQETRALIAHLRGSKPFLEVGEVASLEEARRLLEERKVLVVLHFPPDFERQRRIQLLLDGRNTNTALGIFGYLQTMLSSGRGAPALQVRFWFNPNLESRWFIVPGMVALMTLVATVTIAALSIAREREEGTFDQLRVTPLTPAAIIAGKAFPPFLIGLLEGCVIAVLAVVWFRVPFQGDPLLLLATGALYLLAVVGSGLMVSSLCRTQQQAFVGVFLLVVPTVLLSGFAAPIENMPPLIQKLTLLNPLRYFLVVVRRLFLQGAGLELLWPQILPLLLIAAFTLAVAIRFVGRRIY